jgi:hypothetical protein
MAQDPTYFRVATTLGIYNQCVEWLWELAGMGSIALDNELQSYKTNIIKINDTNTKARPDVTFEQAISMKDNPNQSMIINNIPIQPLDNITVELINNIEETCSNLEGVPIFSQTRQEANENLTQ